MSAGAPPAFLKRWIHSREEDSKKERVMRPHTYPFPKGKERDGFELRADGSYVETAAGTDEVAGTWTLEGFDTLVLSCPQPGRGWRVRVRSVAEDRLVLEK